MRPGRRLLAALVGLALAGTTAAAIPSFAASTPTPTPLITTTVVKKVSSWGGGRGGGGVGGRGGGGGGGGRAGGGRGPGILRAPPSAQAVHGPHDKPGRAASRHGSGGSPVDQHHAPARDHRFDRSDRGDRSYRGDREDDHRPQRRAI